MSEASVRTPQPVNIAGASSRSATAAALSSSTMPVHRQCPMFEAERVDGALVPVQGEGEHARGPAARSVG